MGLLHGMLLKYYSSSKTVQVTNFFIYNNSLKNKKNADIYFTLIRFSTKNVVSVMIK